ncbi:MAG: hypothetical protein DMD77_09160 [Candidatus Rokuibacteriota bacterium]|nr:MAG: hypothetical protein DMD77_09160 [Candidatus Rokubacteria bacterium]
MLKSPDWHLLIVWYFFLGGIAGGAYFTAAIADNFGGPRDKSVIRIGYVLALLLIGLCGILLILDLGTPSRFMNMMRHFKFWDPMSIGAWMLGVFGLFAFVSSALSLVGGEGVAPVRRVVSLVGTIAGFFIAAYTGVLLSATALPLWREARLMGALFLASGASTGMAAIDPRARGLRLSPGQRRGAARDGTARSPLLGRARGGGARPSASRGSHRTQGTGGDSRRLGARGRLHPPLRHRHGERLTGSGGERPPIF